MNKHSVLSRIGTSLIISFLIYITIAAGLILFGAPAQKSVKKNSGSIENRNIVTESIQFDELIYDYSSLPQPHPYTARDGAVLWYRYYPIVQSAVERSDSNTAKKPVLLLIHGSGWHSRYFLDIASNLAETGTAHVYTPDLRGHGENPHRRGDIDYIEQYEDDIYDLLAQIKEKHPGAPIILSGHSSGGGLALRCAGIFSSDDKEEIIVDGLLLLSPYLKYNAPTMRQNSGGWAEPYTGRIIGLVMLNNLGIRFLNGLPVIHFNMPLGVRDGTETLSYSYRLNTGYAPVNYKNDLKKISMPFLLLAGTDDETFFAHKFEPTIRPHLPDNNQAEIELIDGTGHMGIVLAKTSGDYIRQWLNWNF